MAAPAGKPPRLIRALQCLGAALVFGTLAAVAIWFGHNVWQQVQEMKARHANRDVLAQVLQAAELPQQVDDAVGPDGVVLRIRDGSWVAIRYVEGSTLPRSVARDSGGSWFESDRSFGYALAHYRLWQEPRARAKATNDPVWSEEGFLSMAINRQLDAIEQSADLTQARRKLHDLGFEAFKP